MKRKYVFFDIDHTLLSHVGTSHIPPETREALRLLKANGHVPALATGRGAFLTHPIARDLGIELLVCADGAHVLNGGRTLHRTCLPEGALDGLRSLAALLPKEVAAMDDCFIYTDNESEDWRTYFEVQAGYACVRPLREMDRAFLGCLMVRPPLRGDYGPFTTPPAGVLVEALHDFVEMRAAGVSKWNGIERVMEHFRTDASDVITFGDGLNDVEMLRRASIGVAVAGASRAARDAASFVAEDIDDGGILKACRHLKLIPDGD